MSKATKNFIAGALVATLPLFVASLMKDDAQVVQTAAGAVVMDANQAKAEELGLTYDTGLIRPANTIEMILRRADPGPQNIHITKAAALVGSEIKVSETFVVDLVWNQKPLLGTHIYSGRCQFIDGELFDSKVTFRTYLMSGRESSSISTKISSANKAVDKTTLNNFCDRMQENGAFDEFRQAVAVSH